MSKDLTISLTDLTRLITLFYTNIIAYCQQNRYLRFCYIYWPIQFKYLYWIPCMVRNYWLNTWRFMLVFCPNTPFYGSHASVWRQIGSNIYLNGDKCTLKGRFSNLIKSYIFNPIQDGHFRGCSRMGTQKATLPKICHTYLTIMKLGTVIPYQIINHVTHLLSSTDILLTFIISRNTDIHWVLTHNF